MASGINWADCNNSGKRRPEQPMNENGLGVLGNHGMVNNAPPQMRASGSMATHGVSRDCSKSLR